MSTTITSDQLNHYPVLLDKIISKVPPLNGGTLIDCTFGHGGYSEAFLKNPKIEMIGIDRDPDAEFFSKRIKEKFKKRFSFFNLRFSEIDKINLTNKEIVGFLFDLGFSFSQIKDHKKGLSFNDTGRLNMQMGRNTFSAQDVINKLSSEKLERIFKLFGEEKFSKKIANTIVRERNNKIIQTQDLVNIIKSIKIFKGRLHPATKIFQSLRIFVNNEISELINGLTKSTNIVKKNGFIAIVTFNSIEDKIVKYFFNELSKKEGVSRYSPILKNKKKILKLVNKKPIIPSNYEIIKNPASRSSKLRIAVKVENETEVKTNLKQKFQYLLDVEKYSREL